MSGGVEPIALTSSKPSLNLHQNTTTTNLFSFQNLNAIALIIILASSGMVGVQDLSFVLLSFFYIFFFMSKLAFPPLSTTPDPPIFGAHTRLLIAYVSLGAIIGILLPVGYIVHGVLQGDKEGIKAAAPHVFLLASQIVMESVSFNGGYSLPIRVLVPVVYNSMRMYAILDWVKSEIMKRNEMGNDGISDKRLVVGISLAVVNLGFWGFNLFGFLLPFYLPKAFKKYYAFTDNDDKQS
ncbi:uncharacterized protein [Rutidosis leptorrhynchoides]|uniref:uncharacterized protein n=1 Tax=Rutidosis leptorrhynchoides TaxID=125765 RepID=UPI003A991912